MCSIYLDQLSIIVSIMHGNAVKDDWSEVWTPSLITGMNTVLYIILIKKALKCYGLYIISYIYALRMSSIAEYDHS